MINPIEAFKEHLKEQAQEATKEIALGILSGIKDVVVELAYSIALIGGGLSIVLHMAGWEKGKRWTGILTVSYALIKLLLG